VSEIPPKVIAGDDVFRIVRQVSDTGIVHDVLESRDSDDAMGQPRWRPMDGSKALQAMKAYIVRQAAMLEHRAQED
jgi:hypothetical protein